MLWSQVLNGLAAVSLGRHLADQKLVFGWNRDAKRFTIASHIKHGGADYGRLPDHADARWPRRQQERLYLVIFLDDAAVPGTRRRLELYRRIDRLYAQSDLVVFVQQLFLGRILDHRL